MRRAVVEIGRHAAVFVPAQVVLVLLGASWAADLVNGVSAEWLLSGRTPDDIDGVLETCYGVGRIWVFVFLIDAVWRLIAAVRAERRPDRLRSSG